MRPVGMSTSWPSALAFFWLMIGPNSVQDWRICPSECRSCDCYIIGKEHAFDGGLVLNLAMVQNMLSYLVCMYHLLDEFPKVSFRLKKVLNMVGERMLPCFMLLVVIIGIDCWLHTIMKRSEHALKLRGHLIFKGMLKIWPLLTRLKALF